MPDKQSYSASVMDFIRVCGTHLRNTQLGGKGPNDICIQLGFSKPCELNAGLGSIQLAFGLVTATHKAALGRPMRCFTQDAQSEALKNITSPDSRLPAAGGQNPSGACLYRSFTVYVPPSPAWQLVVQLNSFLPLALSAMSGTYYVLNA